MLSASMRWCDFRRRVLRLLSQSRSFRSTQAAGTTNQISRSENGTLVLACTERIECVCTHRQRLDSQLRNATFRVNLAALTMIILENVFERAPEIQEG